MASASKLREELPRLYRNPIGGAAGIHADVLAVAIEGAHLGGVARAASRKVVAKVVTLLRGRYRGRHRAAVVGRALESKVLGAQRRGAVGHPRIGSVLQARGL